MQIKESPIKQDNSHKNNYDISYINKDFNVTPKSKKAAHFSPTTPISELNMLMMQSNTPNGVIQSNNRNKHFDCDSNYNEEDNEDN
jgi:hypothetical protein